MAPSLAAVASLLVILSNIKPTVSEDLDSQCADCCNKFDSHTKILNHIVSQQVTELLSLEVIQGKVVDDFPSTLEKLSTRLEAVTATVTEIHDFMFGPKDCSDIRALGYNTNGVYRVYPGSLGNQIRVDVYCDMTTPGGSWLVFQRREDGSVVFDLNWSDYEAGFGNVTGEFWLGNEKLSLLTTNRKYKLRVELEDFTGEKRFAEYSTFFVNPATDKYRLTVGGYTGNAGDSLTYHNGMQFTTKDADNDVWNGNCAVTFHGAWWHNACHYSNLNGLYLKGSHKSYADGIEWYSWHGYYYSLKTTEMKITAV